LEYGIVTFGYSVQERQEYRLNTGSMFSKFFKFRMSSSIDIDEDAELVWRLLEDAARWAGWSSVCTEVWGVNEDEVLVEGTKLGFKLRMAGREVPFNVSVTGVNRGEFIEWCSTKFSITAVRTISIEQSGNTTRVVDSKQFSSSIIPIRIAYQKGLIRKMTEAWLSDVKMTAESKH